MSYNKRSFFSSISLKMDYRRTRIFSFQFSYHILSFSLSLSLLPLNPDSGDPVRRYHLYTSINIYIYMYLCLYVCINVWIRVRFGGLASGFALGQHSRPLCTHTHYTLRTHTHTQFKRTLTCVSFTIYNMYMYVYIIICVYERVRVCISVNLCARVYLRTSITYIYANRIHMYM